MTKAEIEQEINNVKVAIEVLCFLYPNAGGHNQPQSAGRVLRRFQQRERDLHGFLEIAEDAKATK
jgi:hypothetical protein